MFYPFSEGTSTFRGGSDRRTPVPNAWGDFGSLLRYARLEGSPSLLCLGGRVQKDEFGDWRIAAVTTLAQDVPAAFPGGPAHKAGAPVYLSSFTKHPKHNVIGFVLVQPEME